MCIRDRYMGFVNIKIYDVSGKYDIKEATPMEQQMFAECGAMIYVIDVQAEQFEEAGKDCFQILTELHKLNPKMRYNIFIHKIDTESFQTDEKKNDCVRTIREIVNEELEPLNLKHVTIDYYGTTIYEHCLFEKFSLVVQKVIPQVAQIVSLLDALMTNCRIEKGYIFDVVSKIFLATDSSPSDMQNYAICSDMIDVYIDISCIYGDQKPDDLVNDSQSESTIKLADDTNLYLKQIEKFLVLVCIIKSPNFDRPYLIDHNIEIFKEGLKEIFKLSRPKQQQQQQQYQVQQQHQQQLQPEYIFNQGQSPQTQEQINQLLSQQLMQQLQPQKGQKQQKLKKKEKSTQPQEASQTDRVKTEPNAQSGPENFEQILAALGMKPNK
eukprot:TRINITY_DN2113_c0_g1_i1.p1 TRINITY_DN2113_c0_g1~~TRINITY_DN2113_c0_g1_i1.p1  ORF type:complete len:381 (+),score=56.64 TRINITY_DN2113_c0_g1_i1:70-1212(+)